MFYRCYLINFQINSLIIIFHLQYHMSKIISRNPFTKKINKEYSQITKQQLDKCIQRAKKAFNIQINRTISDKITLMQSLAKNLQKNNEKLANLISTQMGKPIKQAKDEVALVEKHARTYAKDMDKFLSHANIFSDAKKKSIIKYTPLGVLYWIVPFNYPFYLTFRGGLGNLVLGNCLLVKPSPLTPMMAELTQQIMEQSGFNNGQFQQVLTAKQDLDYIMENKEIVGVQFTGSSKTGAIVAESAGKNIKKSVLQLGGNDPLIVLEDASFDDAVKVAVRSRIANAGQLCFSPKRLIIVGNYAYQVFQRKLIQKLKTIRFGDPLDMSTQIGPLASQDFHNNLFQQLKQIPNTWKLLYKSDVKDPFFPIHVYEANPQQPYLKQFFGPIFSLYKARDEKHAIEIANHGQYGLGATCFSRDSGRAEKILDQVRSGMAFINEDPRSGTYLPNGGVGKSGYGRQCGLQGFRQFANVRLVYVN